MPDQKISADTALAGADAATGDLLPVVDVSATANKKMTLEELAVALGTLGIRGVLITSAGTVQIPNGGIVQFAPGVVGAPNLERSSAGLLVIGNNASYTGTFVRSGAFQAQDPSSPSTFFDVTVGDSRQIALSDGTNFNRGIGKGVGQGLRITNGSTGVGNLQAALPVEANTAGSGAPNVLVVTESRGVLTNEGATAENYHTLPAAVAGLEFTFFVQDTDGIRVVAAAGDTIRPGIVAASATGGFIRCATAGATITLVAINDTEWMAKEMIGVWTVDV